jgi:hypothetical protein
MRVPAKQTVYFMALATVSVLTFQACGMRFSEEKKAETVVNPTLETENRIDMSSKIIPTGLNSKPFKVELTVETDDFTGLMLARSTSSQSFTNLHEIDPNNPPAAITPLAAVTSKTFVFVDKNVGLNERFYYAVLKVITLVGAPTNPNSDATLQKMPSPIDVQIPPSYADTYNLVVSQLTSTSELPKVKLGFSAYAQKMQVVRYKNGVADQTFPVLENKTEFIDSNLDYETEYKYDVVRLDVDGLTPVDTKQSTATSFQWPRPDFDRDFDFLTIAQSNLHEYKLTVADKTIYKPIFRLYTSSDLLTWTETAYFSNSTALRRWEVLKTSPEKVYFKIRTYNRADSQLNESEIKTVTVPKDILITTDTSITSLTATNFLKDIGRLSIKNATLDTSSKIVSINVDELVLENAKLMNGSQILNINASKLTSVASRVISFQTPAVSPQPGKSAGALNISLKSASGDLVIQNQGQEGYVGSKGVTGQSGNPGRNARFTACVGVNEYYGAITQSTYTSEPTDGGNGSQGGPGGSGGKSGDSGNINLLVTDSNTLQVSYNNGSTAGGMPGAGGDGGAGGAGGSWGVQSPLTIGGITSYYFSVNCGTLQPNFSTCSNPGQSATCAKAVVPMDYRNGYNGQTGTPGTQGNWGPSGLKGTICETLPGLQKVCY